MNADDDQIRFALGYDHNFVLNKTRDGLALAARVMSRVVAACWKCLPTSPGFSFTRATFSTVRSPGKRASLTNIDMDFVWRRSIFPIRPTMPIFQQQFSNRQASIAVVQSFGLV